VVPQQIHPWISAKSIPKERATATHDACWSRAVESDAHPG
jgi:hypothetical protein